MVKIWPKHVAYIIKLNVIVVSNGNLSVIYNITGLIPSKYSVRTADEPAGTRTRRIFNTIDVREHYNTLAL